MAWTRVSRDRTRAGSKSSPTASSSCLVQTLRGAEGEVRYAYERGPPPIFARWNGRGAAHRRPRGSRGTSHRRPGSSRMSAVRVGRIERDCPMARASLVEPRHSALQAACGARPSVSPPIRVGPSPGGGRLGSRMPESTKRGARCLLSNVQPDDAPFALAGGGIDEPFAAECARVVQLSQHPEGCGTQAAGIARERRARGSRRDEPTASGTGDAAERAAEEDSGVRGW